MTSGNLSEEPIATDNDEARERLSKLADAFLMHNRDIHIRCDDSVVRVFDDQSPVDSDTSQSTVTVIPHPSFARLLPLPVKLPFDVPQILAAGSELKNTFCITNKNYAFLSHHIGDMENYETLKSFEQGVEHFERLFRVKPEAIACDMHPNYLATRYALERAERERLANHCTFNITTRTSPPAWLSTDWTARAPSSGCRSTGQATAMTARSGAARFWLRITNHISGHFILNIFPCLAEMRQSRNLRALRWLCCGRWVWNGMSGLNSVAEFCAEDQVTLRAQLERKINTPMTSSMGRLFDAAAALAGVRQKVNYEGQAAIEFEALADSAEAGKYSFGLNQDRVEVRSAVEALVKDVMAGVPHLENLRPLPQWSG